MRHFWADLKDYVREVWPFFALIVFLIAAIIIPAVFGANDRGGQIELFDTAGQGGYPTAGTEATWAPHIGENVFMMFLGDSWAVRGKPSGLDDNNPDVKLLVHTTVGDLTRFGHGRAIIFEDAAFVDARESWFLHDADGHRIATYFTRWDSGRSGARAACDPKGTNPANTSGPCVVYDRATNTVTSRGNTGQACNCRFDMDYSNAGFQAYISDYFQDIVNGSTEELNWTSGYHGECTDDDVYPAITGREFANTTDCVTGSDCTAGQSCTGLGGPASGTSNTAVDGITLDNSGVLSIYTQANVNNGRLSGLPVQASDGSSYTDAEYYTDLKAAMLAWATAIEGVSADKIFIPSIGPLASVATADTFISRSIDLVSGTSVDGAMTEDWTLWGTNNPNLNADQVAKMLEWARRVNAEDKYVILLAGNWFDIRTNPNWATAALTENLKDLVWANAFLAWQNPKLLLSMWGGFACASDPACSEDASDSFITRYPEDDIHCGTAVDTGEIMIASGVHKREYSGCLILANQTNAAVNVDLDVITPGKTWTNESGQSVSGVISLARASGEILINPDPAQDPVCGNAVLETESATPEECDDGNLDTGDGCNASCVVEAGWSCTAASPSVCTQICGDGVITAAEECDDGGTANGDGCSDSCTVEDGYECSGTPSTCNLICGNSTVDTGETCDDGNQTAGDGCDSDCILEVCGNGVLQNAGGYTEQCDDGNVATGDGCDEVCLHEECGNNKVQAGEDCDPADITDPNDCCDSNCQYEPTTHVCSSDGLFCTLDATCDGAGSCGAQPARNCSDNDICTDDSCDDTDDVCVNTFDATNDPSCALTDPQVEFDMGSSAGPLRPTAAGTYKQSWNHNLGPGNNRYALCFLAGHDSPGSNAQECAPSTVTFQAATMSFLGSTMLIGDDGVPQRLEAWGVTRGDSVTGANVTVEVTYPSTCDTSDPDGGHQGFAGAGGCVTLNEVDQTSPLVRMVTNSVKNDTSLTNVIPGIREDDYLIDAFYNSSTFDTGTPDSEQLSRATTLTSAGSLVITTKNPDTTFESMTHTLSASQDRLMQLIIALSLNNAPLDETPDGSDATGDVKGRTTP